MRVFTAAFELYIQTISIIEFLLHNCYANFAGAKRFFRIGQEAHEYRGEQGYEIWILKE